MKNIALPVLAIILFTLFSEKSYCQDTKANKSFAIRYSTYYNYKVLHFTPNLSFGIGNHDIYIGPEYNYIAKSFLVDSEDKIEKNNWGLNLGYKYYFSKIAPNTSLYGQFNFSVYNLWSYEYQHGYPYVTKNKTLIVENTALLGLRYQLGQKVFLISGVGIGSYDGFFLMVESFIPSVAVGIEYKL